MTRRALVLLALTIILPATFPPPALAVVSGREGGAGDAGNDATSARVLNVGTLGTGFGTLVFSGRVGGVDTADWFKVQAGPGGKVRVDVKPEHEAHVTVGAIPRPPPIVVPPALPSIDIETTMADLDLRLHEPRAAAVVDWSSPPASTPAHVELNVNASGLWAVSLTATLPTNYTMRVSITPVLFVPATSSATACGAPETPILAGSVAGSLRGVEWSAYYAFDATIGDNILVEMLMPEAEGADIDLYLYNATCYQIARSENGKSLFFPGDSPKGASEVVTRLPALRTGSYFVEARRIVGEGSFVLAAQVFTPIPTVPGNDAGTGADASDDQTKPTPLGSSTGAWEGRFEDADPRDVYSFAVSRGQRFVVSFSPAFANAATISLLGAAVDHEVRPAGPNVILIAHQTGLASKVTVVLVPFVGGGNYALSVAST